MTDSPSQSVRQEETNVPAPSANGSLLTPMELLNSALQRGVDVPTLQALMELQERWEKNEARKAFAVAISRARSEIPTIVKTRKVDYPHKEDNTRRTKYQYEDFAAVADTVNPILAAHELSYRFRTEQLDGGAIRVTCILSHVAGHSEENSLIGGRDESGQKNNLQAVGSTVTYLQRYTLKAALGLASASDDDGQASDGNGPITDDQLKTLRAALDEVNGDVMKFCEAMQIDSLAALDGARFGEAMAIIESRKRRRAKAAS